MTRTTNIAVCHILASIACILIGWRWQVDLNPSFPIVPAILFIVGGGSFVYGYQLLMDQAEEEVE